MTRKVSLKAADGTGTLPLVNGAMKNKLINIKGRFWFNQPSCEYEAVR
jgi:hypothetical protein